MMRTKAIAVFLSVVISLVCLSIWQVDRAYFSDQTAQSEASARSQISALIPAAQAEFRSLFEHQRFLTQLTLDKGATEFGDVLSNRIEMIARLKAGVGGDWTVDTKAFHDKTNVRHWAENYTTIALKAVKPRDILPEGAALVALMDPQRRTFFLWIFHDAKDQWSAAVTKPTIFQNLMDRQKGQLSNVFLVNQQAQVLGHTIAEYLGTSMSGDPLVSQVMTSGKRTGSMMFREAGAPVQGFYEQVPGTNVFVVINRPLSVVQKSREAVRWQLVLLGGGFLFVGLAALVYLLRGDGDPIRFSLRRNPLQPTLAMEPLSGATPPSEASASAVPATKDEILRERMQAYTTAAAAVARELNGPMAKILALTRALSSRSLTSEQQTEVQEIGEVARNSRSVLLKLLSFAGEEEFHHEPTSVLDCMNQVLTGFESKFQSKGIKVEKNLKRVPEIKGSALGLTKVLEAVLTNSIEAMERMPSKKLSIDLDNDDKNVIVRIRDSGEGISADHLSRIFDPFFTSKPTSIHSGLGLSMALGIVREFGGEITAQSEVGRGTSTEIRIPALMGESATVSAVPTAAAPPIAPPIAPPVATAPKAQVPPFNPPPAPPTRAPAAPPTATPSAPAAAMTPPPAPPSRRSEPVVQPRPQVIPVVLQERAIRETFEAIDNLDVGKPAAVKPPPPPSRHEIDEADAMEDFVEKKLSDGSTDRPAAPQPPPVRGNEGTVSQKIDRPHIGVRAGSSSLAKADVAIRKPGEKHPPGGRK